MTTPLESLSEFGKAAVALDSDLLEFEKLSADFDRLTFDSDKALEKGLTLLESIQACRLRLESGMHELSKTLMEARARNEKAEQVVAQKSTIVEQRRQSAEQMFARFRTLGEAVIQINTSLTQLKEQAAGGLTPEDKTHLNDKFPEVGNQLEFLIEEARKLVEEAKTAGLKTLERNVDSLRQSLASARNRIKLIAQPQSQPESNQVH